MLSAGIGGLTSALQFAQTQRSQVDLLLTDVRSGDPTLCHDPTQLRGVNKAWLQGLGWLTQARQ